MAEWPDLEELKLVLDLGTEEAFDDSLGDTLASAIAYVKEDVGNWDEETDTPDEALASAALRRAVLMAQNPGAAAETAADPSYESHIRGHRRQFGIG